MARAWASFSSIFGVVPLETSAWKPLTDPQAEREQCPGKHRAGAVDVAGKRRHP